MALGDVLARANDIFNRISASLNQLVIALVIVFVGVILGRILDRLLHKFFLRIQLDNTFSKIFKARRRYALATRRTIVRLVYIAAVVIALERLGLDSVAIVVVLGIFLVIIVVSLGLAGIETVPNLMAMTRLRSRKVDIDDVIEVQTAEGTIKGKIVEMTLTEVRLKRRNGDILYVPAATFLHAAMLRRSRRR